MNPTKHLSVAATILSALLALLTTSGCGNESPDSASPAGNGSVQALLDAAEAPPAATAVTTVRRQRPGAIVVDGTIADWQGIQIHRVGAAPVDHAAGDRAQEMMRRLSAAMNRERFWRSAAFAHDGANLYVLIELSEGVAERYQRTHSTGSVGYIHIDSDGNVETGVKKTVAKTTAGCDRSIWIPLGFRTSVRTTEGTSAGKQPKQRTKTVPYIAYSVRDQILDETIPTSKKDNIDHPELISFAGNHIEMSVPFEFLAIRPPVTVTFILSPLGLADKTVIIANIQ